MEDKKLKVYKDVSHSGCRIGQRCGSLEERLWSRVVKTDTCWVWTGAVSDRGYGKIGDGSGKRSVRVHRVAWELANGCSIPDGFCILHTCDNRLCCHPDHLYLGTNADNTRDMMLRSRHKCVPLVGSVNGRAKLTEGVVQEIRHRLKATLNYRGFRAQLGREYGVSSVNIAHIRDRRTWCHV